MDIRHTTSTMSPYNCLNLDELDHISQYLQSNNQIGLLPPRAVPRLVKLRKTELFNKLVQLYHGVFKWHLPLFKDITTDQNMISSHVVAAGSVFTDTDRIHFIATCYISGWFWDLQATICQCVENTRLHSVKSSEHFSDNIRHISRKYDSFLQHLNSIIRPTHIKMALEDAIYIPIIAEGTIKPYGRVFNIPNSHLDESITRSIIYIMGQHRNQFSLEPLSTSNLGRPGWLFDYHSGNAYSWFPIENNYSFVDLIAPHILGILLSPRLGPCDLDEWQIFPGGVLPAGLDPMKYTRVSRRSFFGTCEYTTIEQEKYTFPTVISNAGSYKDPQLEPLSVYRYRIVDWTYHRKVTISCAIEEGRDMAFYSFFGVECF